jgi:flagellar hook-associated protein 2
MTAVTFTGLSSGIDTASLVTQLVAAERAPADAIANHQSDLNTQKSVVGNLSTALAALGTAVRGLSLPSEAQPRKASSSDGHVTVAASSGAIATVHDVRVKQLARGAITSSRTFSSAGAGVLGTGSVTITTGTTTKTIDYDSVDSLSDIAARINGSGVAASASVLFDGTSYQLMVASTGTGTAAAAQFTDSGDSLQLSDPDNVKIPARDAIATIDGVDVTRSRNVIDDAVTGVTFSLVAPHAATDASATVAVALDSDGLRGQLKSIVAAYNAVNSALHAQLDYSGTRKGTDTLFGDSTLRQLQGALGSVMSNSYGPAVPGATAATLAATGTTLGAIGLVRDKAGTLTLDDTKLSAALAANPNAIGDLFVTGGFAAAMTTMTDAYTRTGDGILAAKTDGLADRFKSLQSTADQINARADALKTQLEAQFTALETAMTQLKSQSSYLTKIFG